MNDSPVKEHKLLNNPFFIVTVVCLIALMMSAVSFLMYYRSETRLTVEQLQKNTAEIEQKTSTDLQANGELNAAYIDSVEQQIKDVISSHDNTSDFNSAELSDSALGL